MIPRTADLGKDNNHKIPDWNAEMARAVTDPAELLRILELDKSLFLDNARLASRSFSVRVPHGYIARMNKGDPNDPLLKQVLPLGLELESVDGFVSDPVSDHTAMVAPGILQKYHGRALLITTGACAIHCRYCFRRHFPYTDTGPSWNGWRSSLEYIASNPGITEVILSGGDPLSLSDKRLAELIHEIGKITHVSRLRIHTRLPVVLPERINESLVQILHSSRLATVMVIHANHPNEINEPVSRVLKMLDAKGIRLLNQSVLLKGINDHPETLAELSEALFDSGVLPYYLHLLDKVAGAAHFDVEETDAIKLLKMLNTMLPGYLVPKMVKEIPGKAGKTPITG
ncbi:MAG: EF-P beta-lysylation protein EpmB [Gammaproteobacteria bacterium]|nr:EF-P beta-lysylation protein EpmB [Gammaproteobacteria bacterium]